MIKRFQLFERLGYNEEVSKLAEYVWGLYKKGERVIDLRNYNKSIDLNTIYIEEINDKKDKSGMSFIYNGYKYKKDKSVRIEINKFYKPQISSMEHEIKHIYDLIKRGGFSEMKDKKKLGAFTSMYDDEIKEINTFLYIMYITEMNEIEAYYHSDIRNYKKNQHKFKNINKFLKYSRLQKNLDYLNKNDITEILSKITDEYKGYIMDAYEKINSDSDKYSGLSELEYKFIDFKEKIINYIKDNFLTTKDKEYTEKEINKFYNSLIKEVEKKKKVYLRYIGRLWAYFN